MQYNHFQIAGFLTRDPEYTVTPGGTGICKFSVATNHKYKEQEEVLFMSCTAFGKTGELITEHFKKGKPIFAEGRLKEEKWTDKKTGAERSKIVLLVEKFAFIGGKKDADDEAPPF